MNWTHDIVTRWSVLPSILIFERCFRKHTPGPPEQDSRVQTGLRSLFVSLTCPWAHPRPQARLP